jgi:hypothetical protein
MDKLTNVLSFELNTSTKEKSQDRATTRTQSEAGTVKNKTKDRKKGVDKKHSNGANPASRLPMCFISPGSTFFIRKAFNRYAQQSTRTFTTSAAPAFLFTSSGRKPRGASLARD